ncbi:16319_t:CDS:2, partial [Funneliformis mosseae]
LPMVNYGKAGHINNSVSDAKCYEYIVRFASSLTQGGKVSFSQCRIPPDEAIEKLVTKILIMTSIETMLKKSYVIPNGF